MALKANRTLLTIELWFDCENYGDQGKAFFREARTRIAMSQPFVVRELTVSSWIQTSVSDTEFMKYGLPVQMQKQFARSCFQKL